MKIKVDYNQATDLIKAGFDVECYFEIPGKTTAKKQLNGATRRPVIPMTAMIALSVEHKGPSKGVMYAIWEKTRKELWGKDLTATYTRGHIEATLKKDGNKDRSMFAYCMNKLNCVRPVDGWK